MACDSFFIHKQKGLSSDTQMRVICILLILFSRSFIFLMQSQIQPMHTFSWMGNLREEGGCFWQAAFSEKKCHVQRPSQSQSSAKAKLYCPELLNTFDHKIMFSQLLVNGTGHGPWSMYDGINISVLVCIGTQSSPVTAFFFFFLLKKFQASVCHLHPLSHSWVFLTHSLLWGLHNTSDKTLP